ncbi:type IV secretory system conjugative DNA transfer family protein [Nonomuraea sp. NPDC026600]|uniref:type IV secretory system conjugative DNA transfer family protein n=1 Tax=Nonomuraea sp. NPDC026600 TaxID=3155363 RepID=UPI0033E14A2F
MTPDPWSGVHLPSPAVGIAFAVTAIVLLIGAQLAYRALIPVAGFATAWQLRRHMSGRSAHRVVKVTRPSLVGQRGVPVQEYSYRLGRSYSPFLVARCTPEDCALVLGPPGVGKSALIGDIVVDAPGAVVHTTSKIGDVDTTAAARALVGPVLVFNPLGLGGVESTLRVNPVRGCKDPRVAVERGAALLYGSRSNGDGGGLQDYFTNNANEVLRAFLMAADIAGLTLVDVHRWANDPKCTDALKILTRGGAPETWTDALRARQEVTERTRDGIFSTLATALSWLSDPAAVYAVTPAAGEDFDVARFLAARGTLYMVGEDTAGVGVAPLFTMLINDVVTEAVRLADHQPGRRLDPYLTLALDEVATICPVPLDQWINKLRAHGVLLIAGIQSKAQLYDRWGKSGGDAIWNAAAATVVFGGLKSAEDLREISTLCGEREVRRRSVQHTAAGPIRSEHDELRPVMPPHKIRNLRKRRALVLYRGLPPVIVRVRQPWRRRDVRQASSSVHTLVRSSYAGGGA